MALRLWGSTPAAQSMELECDGAPDADFLLAVAGVKQVQRDGERIVLAIDDLTRVAPGVFGTLAQKGCTVRSVSSGHANLEDVFLALTGRQLRDAP